MRGCALPPAGFLLGGVAYGFGLLHAVTDSPDSDRQTVIEIDALLRDSCFLL